MLAAVALIPLVSGQVQDVGQLGCPARIAFDLSTVRGASFEWTSADDPTGANNVYLPSGDPNFNGASCSSGAGASWFPPLGSPEVDPTNPVGPTCPTVGVPFGLTADTQYDQEYPSNYLVPGYAPWRVGDQPTGVVRIKNVASDADNNNRQVDILITKVPDNLQNAYTTQLSASYNSPVMPWNNDVPSTQFTLTSSGLIALGFGVLPSLCAGDTYLEPRNRNCADSSSPTGYGSEYEMEFVYGDTFSWAQYADQSYEVVSPPLDPITVTFWDVDGDRVDNGLSASTLIDATETLPQDANDVFPESAVLEDLQEIQAVHNPERLLYRGSNLKLLSGQVDGQAVIGLGPQKLNDDEYADQSAFCNDGITRCGNVKTDFSSNPYHDLSAFEDADNVPAIAIYRTQNSITKFKLLVGAISAVGRQFQPRSVESSGNYAGSSLRPVDTTDRPQGIRADGTTNSFLDKIPNSADGPYPKRQNDRGYLASILYPEPCCGCGDPCPAECASATESSSITLAYCARNPNCGCPGFCADTGQCSLCSTSNPPFRAPPDYNVTESGPITCPIECAFCGSHPECPSIPCPAECEEGRPLAHFYSYCKTNPNCACPSSCAGCSNTAQPGSGPSNTVQPGSSSDCAYDCGCYPACTGTPRTCNPPPIPSPPPFPPPFPPLPCFAWCNVNTCGHEECAGCSTCEALSSGDYCASWCNAYTCASEHDLCQGCVVCKTIPDADSCPSWCNAYTCFGSCTPCSTCQTVLEGSYCASWCNAYTCGGVFGGFCGGCSECRSVLSGHYCASWCNSYTHGGIFASHCGGC